MDLVKVGTIVFNKIIAWVETAAKMLPNMVVAVLCLILFWLLAILVGRLVYRMVSRLSIYRHVANLTARLSRLVVILTGILLAVNALNLDRVLASMLAGIGIVGLGLSLAAKNTGGDYLAGFLIHFTHPYRMGHLIQVGNFLGHVVSLELRSTKIHTQQGQSVIIPNHRIMENELTNYTITGERRVDLKCGVSYEEDLQQVEELAIKAVESVKTRNPERDVELFYEEFGDSSVLFTIRFWTDPEQKIYLTARSQAIKAIKQTFEDHGIIMPYPTRTLDFSAPKGGRLRDQLEGLGRSLPAPSGGKPEEKTGKKGDEKRTGKKSAEREPD
jgi:small conductance mechanosensitive channel